MRRWTYFLELQGSLGLRSLRLMSLAFGNPIIFAGFDGKLFWKPMLPHIEPQIDIVTDLTLVVHAYVRSGLHIPIISIFVWGWENQPKK